MSSYKRRESNLFIDDSQNWRDIIIISSLDYLQDLILFLPTEHQLEASPWTTWLVWWGNVCCSCLKNDPINLLAHRKGRTLEVRDCCRFSCLSAYRGKGDKAGVPKWHENYTIVNELHVKWTNPQQVVQKLPTVYTLYMYTTKMWTGVWFVMKGPYKCLRRFATY